MHLECIAFFVGARSSRRQGRAAVQAVNQEAAAVVEELLVPVEPEDDAEEEFADAEARDALLMPASISPESWPPSSITTLP